MTGAECARMPGCLCARMFHCFIDGSDRQVEIEGDRGTGVCYDTLLVEDTGYKDSVTIKKRMFIGLFCGQSINIQPVLDLIFSLGALGGPGPR